MPQIIPFGIVLSLSEGLGLTDWTPLEKGFKWKGSGDSGSEEKKDEIGDIEKKANEAEAKATEEAKVVAREKLKKQTQTIFTSGLGVLGTDKTKSTLGSN